MCTAAARHAHLEQPLPKRLKGCNGEFDGAPLALLRDRIEAHAGFLLLLGDDGLCSWSRRPDPIAGHGCRTAVRTSTVAAAPALAP